jgi:nucleoside-diphosphate-sugar epimerase
VLSCAGRTWQPARGRGPILPNPTRGNNLREIGKLVGINTMRVLIFGASGYIGGHIARRLLAEGHQVTTPVRSAAKGEALAALGAATPVAAAEAMVADPAPFAAHDAVIWCAQLMLEEEHDAVRRMLDYQAAQGDKVFIFTSGTSLLSERTDGDWSENSYAEDEPFTPRRQVAPRLAIENMVRDAAGTGVRAFCVRPPMIWGKGGSRVISDLYHSGQATGAVCYVGRGLNLYSSVHVDDLAELYALALHRGVGGALYHAVSGELNFRSMAQAIAGHLGVGTRSVSVAESIDVWDRFTGPLTMSSCSRTRCPRARKDLGWSPDPGRLDILDDCGHATYRNQPPRALPAWVRTDAPQSTRAA